LKQVCLRVDDELDALGEELRDEVWQEQQARAS
jgi:hypothetical protein